MAITKEEIIEAVGNMSVMDLNDLVKAFEEKFGVSAAAMAVAGPASITEPPTFLKLVCIRPPNKLYRSITNSGEIIIFLYN